MPEHAGQLDPGLERAVPRQHVVEADVAGLHLDDHVPWSRYRLRDLLELHRVEPTGLSHDHRLHFDSRTNFIRARTAQVLRISQFGAGSATLRRVLRSV